jgi:RsiW-degrading membrane proteinase PrsW (M82 family)
LAAVFSALIMALAGFATLLAVGAETGGVAFGTGLVMAVLPLPVYLGVSLWIDRFEPEPKSLVLFTFFWGATIAVLVALVLNTAGQVVVGEALGGGAAEIYGGSISAPVVEECAKAAALLIVYHRRKAEFNGVVDGIVYAILVGLGFATSENVLYYSRGAFEEGVPGAIATFVLRGVLSPFAHPLFTAMFGIGLGLASRSRRRSTRTLAPLAGLALAIALHALWNTAAAAGLALTVYVFLFAPLFFGLLALVVLARSREGQLVRRQLQPELSAGWLTPGELEMLASVRARRRALSQVGATRGRPARRSLRSAQEAATELAFHRDRAQRGLGGEELLSAEQRRLAERLRELRAATGGAALA